MQIDDNTTLAQLRAMPLSEAIAALNPTPVQAKTHRQGPFGNIGVRPMNFKGAGDQVRLHAHNFDHCFFVAKGIVHIKAQEFEPLSDGEVYSLEQRQEAGLPPEIDLTGEEIMRRCRFIGPVVERTFRSNSFGLIKKNWAHTFVCIEPPVTAMCLFAMRTAHGDIVEPEMWDGTAFFMT